MIKTIKCKCGYTNLSLIPHEYLHSQNMAQGHRNKSVNRNGNQQKVAILEGAVGY